MGLPKDSFSHLAATTFDILTPNVANTLNKLLDWLDNDTSCIVKVNCLKFSIKADVFVHGMRSLIKIRCYSAEKGRIVLGFQRRAGDCISFNRAYRLIAQQLTALKRASMDPLDAFELPLALPPTEDAQGDCELGPLADMLASDDMPELQAESLMVLSQKAEETQACAWFCEDKVIDRIVALLQHSRIDIAYPAACCVRALAQQEKASQGATNSDLANALVSGLSAFISSPLAEHTLVTKTLNIAMEIFSTGFSALSSNGGDTFSGATIGSHTPGVKQMSSVPKTVDACSFEFAGFGQSVPFEAPLQSTNGSLKEGADRNGLVRSTL